MPFVRITHRVDALTRDQKQQLVQGVQDAVVAIEGETLRAGVGVVLDDNIENDAHTSNCLPFISVTLLRGALDLARRRAMTRLIVEAVVKVEGEARRGNTWVVIEEIVAEGEWSIGGNPLTLTAMQRIREGLNPWPNNNQS